MLANTFKYKQYFSKKQNDTMKKSIIIATAFLLLGCNSSTNNQAENKIPASGTAASSSAINSVPPSATGTEISVTLTGGANAGTYTAASAGPTCSEGLTGKNSFGNQYSVQGKADNEFSSLQLIIDDKDAAKNGTDKFYLKVAFGKILHGKAYQINGGTTFLSIPKTGSGRATLDESGNTKTVTIEGKTKDGVGISAKIVCHGVETPNGVQ